MPAQMNSSRIFPVLCTLSLYDADTGEALTSYRVEIHGAPVPDPTGQLTRRAFLAPESRGATTDGRHAVLGGIDGDTALTGVDAPVKLHVTVDWPEYRERTFAIAVSEGDTIKVELDGIDGPAETPEASAFTDRRSRFHSAYAAHRQAAPPAADRLWEAFQVILEAQSYRDRAAISRARKATALLFHQDGVDCAVAAQFRDAHARANAFLDERERGLP